MLHFRRDFRYWGSQMQSHWNFSSKEYLSLNRYPSLQCVARNHEKNGINVSRNSNFSVLIDLIWKCGDHSVLCGVQVNISKHHNVLKKFAEMCKKARWLEKFKKIYLLYSSPEQCAANSVQCLSIPKTQGQQITVVTLVYHAKAVYPVSAKSLQWPKKGCEEGSFCSIWGEGSLSSRGHVHVVLRT